LLPLARLAAEQRDEIAPFHLTEVHQEAKGQERLAGYRIGEDQSARRS
jgi:hypothetical protein